MKFSHKNLSIKQLVFVKYLQKYDKRIFVVCKKSIETRKNQIKLFDNQIMSIEITSLHHSFYSTLWHFKNIHKEMRKVSI